MNLNVFVATFIFNGDAVLLLERADSAGFAPGKWTGVGGKVERDELDDLEAAALREIFEETGLRRSDLSHMRLKFVLALPEAGGISALVFFSAQTRKMDVGPCDEGNLHWVLTEELKSIDMIDNASRVLDVLIQDRQTGNGITHYGVSRPGGDTDWASL